MYIQKEADRSPRRVDQDVLMFENDYARCFPNPRRYPVLCENDIEKMIIGENNEYLIADKPAGMINRSLSSSAFNIFYDTSPQLLHIFIYLYTTQQDYHVNRWWT